MLTPVFWNSPAVDTPAHPAYLPAHSNARHDGAQRCAGMDVFARVDSLSLDLLWLGGGVILFIDTPLFLLHEDGNTTWSRSYGWEKLTVRLYRRASS